MSLTKEEVDALGRSVRILASPEISEGRRGMVSGVEFYKKGAWITA